MNFNVPIMGSSFYIPVNEGYGQKSQKSNKPGSSVINNSNKKSGCDNSKNILESAKKIHPSLTKINANQSTPRKSLSTVSSRLREETISSSIKKFTKSVKFTNPDENKSLHLSNKKPSLAPNSFPHIGKAAPS